MKQIKGKIRFIDATSGDGAVRSEDGITYFLHFTGINGINKNNHHWPADSDLELLRSIDEHKPDCEFNIMDGQAYNLNLIVKL